MGIKIGQDYSNLFKAIPTYSNHFEVFGDEITPVARQDKRVTGRRRIGVTVRFDAGKWAEDENDYERDWRRLSAGRLRGAC